MFLLGVERPASTECRQRIACWYQLPSYGLLKTVEQTNNTTCIRIPNRVVPILDRLSNASPVEIGCHPHSRVVIRKTDLTRSTNGLGGDYSPQVGLSKGLLAIATGYQTIWKLGAWRSTVDMEGLIQQQVA